VSLGYEINETHLVGYKGKERKISIPDIITVVHTQTFKGNKNITKVWFPNSVNLIHSSAFMGWLNFKMTVSLTLFLQTVFVTAPC